MQFIFLNPTSTDTADVLHVWDRDTFTANVSNQLATNDAHLSMKKKFVIYLLPAKTGTIKD